MTTIRPSIFVLAWGSLVLCACGSTPPAEAPNNVVVELGDGQDTKPKTADDAKTAADARAAEIASELAELEVSTIGAIGGSEMPTDGILGSSDVPPGLLDDAALGVGGSGGLVLGGAGSGSVRPGGAGGVRAGGGGSIAAGGGGSASPNAAIASPKGDARVAAPHVTGGQVANATSVVARMRGRFRACYNRGLRTNPTIRGTSQLTAKIGPNGEVLGVAASSDPSLAAVVPCFKAVVYSGGFSPPSTGAASVSFVVELTPR